jgi:hypothetical protein
MRIAYVMTRADAADGAVRDRGLTGALRVIAPVRAWIVSALRVPLSAFAREAAV